MNRTEGLGCIAVFVDGPVLSSNAVDELKQQNSIILGQFACDAFRCVESVEATEVSGRQIRLVCERLSCPEVPSCLLGGPGRPVSLPSRFAERARRRQPLQNASFLTSLKLPDSRSQPPGMRQILNHPTVAWEPNTSKESHRIHY